jgi:hypothetical protein
MKGSLMILTWHGFEGIALYSIVIADEGAEEGGSRESTQAHTRSQGVLCEIPAPPSWWMDIFVLT